jgi:hypothetical protein
MWQSLADNFTQPIAVFASKGPIKGINKLLVTLIKEIQNNNIFHY